MGGIMSRTQACSRKAGNAATTPKMTLLPVTADAIPALETGLNLLLAVK
jgi:hypothetical protein